MDIGVGVAAFAGAGPRCASIGSHLCGVHYVSALKRSVDPNELLVRSVKLGKPIFEGFLVFKTWGNILF